MEANNNQKMREALEEAQKRLEQMVGCDMHRYHREAQTCDGQTTTGDCAKMATCKVIFQIRSALTAPPRNCDKCNSADEAVALAIDAGVVDCNFGAREMAEFLLAEMKGGAK